VSADTAAPLAQLAKEPGGGVAISAGLEQDVDDLAVLVDGPPEILTLTAMRARNVYIGVRLKSGVWPVKGVKGFSYFSAFLFFYVRTQQVQEAFTPFTRSIQEANN
jgi:hypothetical protein